MGATQGLSAWAFVRTGSWRALDGLIRTRGQHPRAFWTSFTLQIVLVAVSIAAAGFLAWSLLLQVDHGR